jgi:hypothetical protein
MNILFTVDADEIEVGDQIIVDGDPIEVTSVSDSNDPDEVVVKGYSHDTGDSVEYNLYFADQFEVWAV